MKKTRDSVNKPINTEMFPFRDKIWGTGMVRISPSHILLPVLFVTLIWPSSMSTAVSKLSVCKIQPEK
jgi:hypothetical protein